MSKSSGSNSFWLVRPQRRLSGVLNNVLLNRCRIFAALLATILLAGVLFGQSAGAGREGLTVVPNSSSTSLGPPSEEMHVGFWQGNNCEGKANAIRVAFLLDPKENPHHVGRLLKGKVSKIVSTGSYA